LVYGACLCIVFDNPKTMRVVSGAAASRLIYKETIMNLDDLLTFSVKNNASDLLTANKATEPGGR